MCDITEHKEGNIEELKTYRYCFTEADVAPPVGTPRLRNSSMRALLMIQFALLST
jgi:hypothetical protein